MSSWKVCCPSYARKTLAPVTTCRVNPTETNYIRGGSTDQERMDRPLDSACGCKRPAPAAYATGGVYKDSSFLVMKYAAAAAAYKPERGQQQEQCCIKPSTTAVGIAADSKSYTNDTRVMAKVGCNICGN
jgi:hypothetical protein